ncbi:MAG: hypothetical protein KGH61_04555, partial [Candidatus Micrarchaeota archaeon]|nr:hypothetical protein [Candidatus Micrarchaeota archaeon]
EKAGLIEYNGEKYETDRWKFLIKQATEHINFCLTLVSFVLWYSAAGKNNQNPFKIIMLIYPMGLRRGMLWT